MRTPEYIVANHHREERYETHQTRVRFDDACLAGARPAAHITWGRGVDAGRRDRLPQPRCRTASQISYGSEPHLYSARSICRPIESLAGRDGRYAECYRSTELLRFRQLLHARCDGRTGNFRARYRRGSPGCAGWGVASPGLAWGHRRATP